MANVPRTEFHEKLSDLTECSICADIFTNPKTLPCIHTFCLHCLEKYGKDKSPGNPMACPICRNEFFIPQEGFCSLPNNFFVGKIVEIGKLATVTAREAVCDLCFEQSAVAKKFCIDCEQKLCDRCNMSHSRIKHCQNHQVVELGSQLNFKELNLRNSYCEHHPKELIKMFCHEDNGAICLICCVESHQSHRCSNIDKAAGQFTEQLKDDLRKVANRRPECEEAFQKLEKFKKEFTEEVTKTEENIRKSGAQLKELIDQHTEDLVKKLRVVRDRNLKCFETTKQDVGRFRVMIGSYQRYCDEILARGSPVDICRAANQMHTRAIDLEKHPVNCSVNDFYCDKISFHAANLDMRMKQHGINNIVGELTVSKSTDRNVKFQKSISVSVPCESVGVLMRFLPMDLGAVDVITKYMKFELQKLEAEIKACCGSIDTAKSEPGFIIRGNETEVGKAAKDLQKLTDSIIMYDHDIDRPGIPAYFYSKHGKEVLRGIQTSHKVSIQLDKTQERAKPQALGGDGPEVGRMEMTPGKFMIPTRRDTIDIDGVFNADNVDLRRYGGVADVFVRPENSAGATQRTRTIADPRQQSEEREERQPQDLSRIILSIYALSRKAIEDVLKDIEEVIKEYIIDKVLDSPQDQENIAKLHPEQVKRIKDMTNIFPVQIEMETGRLKRIRIRGPPMAVTSVMDQVHNIFQEAYAKDIKKKEETWIATVVQWEYEDGTDYENYPDKINAIIERAYRDRKPHAEWEEENAKYRLTFQTMVEELMTTAGTPPVKVRRYVV